MNALRTIARRLLGRSATTTSHRPRRVAFESLEPRAMMAVGVAPLPSLPLAPLTAPAWVGTLVSDTQKDNLTKLVADVQGIRAGSLVTADQITDLVADLKVALGEVTGPPGAAAVTALANDLKAHADLDTLCGDLGWVLRSAGISKATAQMVTDDVKQIVTASGVTWSDVDLIVSDVTAIVSEFHAQHPAVGGGTTAPRLSGQDGGSDAGRKAVLSTIVSDRQGSWMHIPPVVVDTIFGWHDIPPASILMTSIAGDRR